MRWGLVFAMLVGCRSAKHVTIHAPPDTLTQSQRIQTFQYYRIGGEGMETTTSCSNRGCTSTSRRLLVLGDGTEVRHAEDLIPLLPENTIAGLAARNVARHEQRGRMWRRIALVSVLGGLAVAVVAERLDHHDFAVGSTAVGLGVGLIGLGGSMVNYMDAKSETDEVFDNYNQALAQRLAVCVAGYQLVPCEGYAAGAGPPSQTPPIDPAVGSLRQK